MHPKSAYAFSRSRATVMRLLSASDNLLANKLNYTVARGKADRPLVESPLMQLRRARTYTHTHMSEYMYVNICIYIWRRQRPFRATSRTCEPFFQPTKVSEG